MHTPEEVTAFQRRLMLSWLLMLGLTLFLLLPRIQRWLGTDVRGEPRPVTARGALADFEKTAIDVFRTASPSVVFVNTHAVVGDVLTQRAWEVDTGTGSGFVWDEQGHIVTNFHVIKRLLDDRGRLRSGRFVHVEFADQSFPAEVVGSSQNHDLSVLRIDAPEHLLQPVMIGTSSDLQVGQSVFALGHPYRLGQTYTTGVVSARSVKITSPSGVPIEDVIQIDAAINPGNSGGPLLDSAGRLIGVNTAIYSPTGTSAGIGFAIPVDTVNRVVPEIIEEGSYSPPRIGISTLPELNDLLARQTGLQAVVIHTVHPNTPAEAAGLRGIQTRNGRIVLGDVILKVNDERVTNLNELLLVLDHHESGDQVTLTILRNGSEQTAELTLE